MKYQTIIIGAGVAGIFAARELREHGHHNILILEAAADIGGRVRTHFSKSGKAHELGASFLHSEPENPFAQWLLNHGHRLTFLEPAEHIVINGKVLSAVEMKEFTRHYEDVRIQADILSHKNTNAMADQLLKGDGASRSGSGALAHKAAVYAFAGPTETGAELSELSLLDVAGQVELHQNALLKGSLQDALRDAAKNLPIKLNTPIQKINYEAEKILLTTNAGEYQCDHLIVTASVDVLLDQLQFMPALPAEKQNALQNLRLGNLNKIIVKHEEMLWPFSESFYALLLDDTHGPCEVWIMPHAPSTLNILYGGQRAQCSYDEFAAQFLPQLTQLLPALKDNPVQWQQATDWRAEPYIRGSYSMLRAGDENARAAYSEPLQGRIFFAGEAAEGEWATQLPGAMLSGQAAARRVWQRR